MKLWNEYSKEKKKDLILKAKEGDNSALATIWLSMERAIRKRAHSFKYVSGSLEIDDLVQEGFVSFKRSIENFDVENGADLLGYAVNNFANEIHQIISNKGESVRLPKNWNSYKFKISKAMQKLEIDTITKDNIESVSHETKINASLIQKITDSLISSPRINNEETFKTMPSIDENDEYPEDLIIKLEKIHSNLDEEEFNIFRLLMGLGVKQLTKTLLIKNYGYTRHKIDGVVAKARNAVL